MTLIVHLSHPKYPSWTACGRSAPGTSVNGSIPVAKGRMVGLEEADQVSCGNCLRGSFLQGCSVQTMTARFLIVDKEAKTVLETLEEGVGWGEAREAAERHARPRKPVQIARTVMGVPHRPKGKLRGNP